MRFNTTQVQELAGIRREQLRHWKTVLQPLSGRDGRADAYTFAEVVAIAYVAAAANGLGISVSRLAPIATEIFAFVADEIERPLVGERLCYLDLNGRSVGSVIPDAPQFVVISLSNLLACVQSRLAPEQRRQMPLPFS